MPNKDFAMGVNTCRWLLFSNSPDFSSGSSINGWSHDGNRRGIGSERIRYPRMIETLMTAGIAAMNGIEQASNLAFTGSLNLCQRDSVKCGGESGWQRVKGKHTQTRLHEGFPLCKSNSKLWLGPS